MIYRNVEGRFEDVSEQLGPPATTPKAGRGTAFGDVDNNGTVDVVINNVHDVPDVFLTTAPADRRLARGPPGWPAVESQCHRRASPFRHGQHRSTAGSGGGGSYLSQNDLRAHVGLGASVQVDRLEVRWPNGREEQWSGVKADQVATLVEGTSPNLGTGTYR